MGKADLIKFLGAFADWFPIIILIPSLSLLFNIQGRFLGLCGIRNPYQYNDDNDTEANNGPLLDADIEEGERLVKEERRAREREINPNARISVNSARNREYINKKYARPGDSLRSERDRRVDEILSGRSNHERYHDSPESSAVSTSSDDQPPDSVKLKTNLISFGDTVKNRLGGLFSSLKTTNTSEPENTITPSPPPVSPSLPSSPPPPQHEDNTPRIGGGRVFGRPATNENYRPFHNATYNDDDDESEGFRSTSPNPFLMASSTRNSNVSPFARFDTKKTPNHNIFDDI